MTNDMIERESSDWDLSDCSPCDPHDIRVNDLGLLQCRDCLCQLNEAPEAFIIDSLKKDHELDWKERFDELDEIKRLLNEDKYDQLIATYCEYIGNTMEPHTEYTFYEKSK